jgi:small-conductance mechanosensitive channel
MSWEQVRDWLDFSLITIGDTDVTVATVITVVVIVALTVWISRLVERGAARMLRVARVEDEGSLAIAGSIAYYIVLAVGLGIAFGTIGINLTTLFAAGAVFAVAIGFAAQNVLQSFFSGLILLSEGAIKPGHVLEVEGRMVRVTRMGIRSTFARTRDEEELILPNTLLAQSTVKNYTLHDSILRLRTVVGVSYGSDMKQVKQVLLEAAAGVPARLQSRDPVALMAEFGSSSVNWDVSIWIQDPWTTQATRSALNEAIWWALQDAGITIAFPQMDVHFDPPVVERLEPARPVES